MDVELQPEALADLMSQLSHGRERKFDRVIIQGGLVLSKQMPDLKTSHQITFDPGSDSGVRDAIQYAFYKVTIEKYGFTTGAYYPESKLITINPDTRILLGLLFPSTRSRRVSSATQSRAEQSTTPPQQAEIHTSLSHTLLEELEHGYQRGIQHTSSFVEIVPLLLLNKIFDMGAKRKARNPRLLQIAQEAIKLGPLISDKEILEYFHFARSIPGNRGLFYLR